MAQAIPIGLSLAATAMQAGGQLSASRAQAGALNSEADQLDVLAGQDRATSQRNAYEQTRNARILQSRALAVAASSGGGASDPTVVNILANLSGEGAYRAMTALYEGETQARGRELEADTRRKEAKNAKKAGIIGAVGTALQGTSTMYGRYANGGFSGAPAGGR